MLSRLASLIDSHDGRLVEKVIEPVPVWPVEPTEMTVPAPLLEKSRVTDPIRTATG